MPNLSMAIHTYLTRFDYQIRGSLITCFDIEIREDRGGKCKGRRENVTLTLGVGCLVRFARLTEGKKDPVK